MRQRVKAQEANHAVSGLFVFVLMGVFMILALFIVVLGVQVYQSVLDRGDQSNTLRTAVSYVANKVRTMDAVDCISLEENDGKDVLVLRELLEDGEVLETRIYFQEGVLSEQYGYAGGGFDWEDGNVIARIDDFDLQLNGQMLTIAVGVGEERVETSLGLRSAPGTGGQQ